jgi:exonuclease VII large subunit
MEKGYAFVTDDQGNMINSTAQTRAGAELRIQMMDGTLDASVQRILKESWDDNE